MERRRKLLFFKDYFLEFFNRQSEKTKEKIDYVLFLVTVTDQIPKKFFEQITGYAGLYAIRIEFESNIYRIFCCFDKGKLVVLFNAFQKKSQKTPAKEIKKALRIMQEYFEYSSKRDRK